MSNKNYLKYFNLSYHFFFTLIASALVGYLLDSYLELRFFVFTFSLPILGFFYSLYRIYKSEKE